MLSDREVARVGNKDLAAELNQAVFFDAKKHIKFEAGEPSSSLKIESVPESFDLSFLAFRA